MLNIKFRVWDRNVKVMAKVNQINFHSDYTYPQVIYRYKDPCTGKVTDERANFGWDDGCDTVRVMQYTGLKDSNGKEIYEGDILKVINTYKNSDHKPFKVVVTYEDGSFVMHYVDPDMPNSLGEYNHMDSWSDYVVFEVVGNRYENPDLLKEHWLEKAENAEKGRKMMNQKIEYIDESGRRILPAGFDVKKAERIMGNFLNYHSLRHTTFSEVVSSLILFNTGYDGGTSSNYLCSLLGVDGGDMATLKRWKARAKP